MLNPSVRISKIKLPAPHLSLSLSASCLLLTCSVAEFWVLLGTVKRPRKRRTTGICMPGPTELEYDRESLSNQVNTSLPQLFTVAGCDRSCSDRCCCLSFQSWNTQVSFSSWKYSARLAPSDFKIGQAHGVGVPEHKSRCVWPKPHWCWQLPSAKVQKSTKSLLLSLRLRKNSRLPL